MIVMIANSVGTFCADFHRVLKFLIHLFVIIIPMKFVTSGDSGYSPLCRMFSGPACPGPSSEGGPS
jgi:hypothetical protein